MFLTTENGEMEIKVDDEVFVKGTPVNYKGLAAVEINGYNSKNIFDNTAVILNDKNKKVINGEIFVKGKVVVFQGVRPVVQFIGDSRKITLNNLNDAKKVQP